MTASGPSDAVPIAPQRVIAEIEAALGPEDILVCDASLASGWGGVYLEQRAAGRRVLCPRGQACLGYGVPAAIGAATARPGGRTIVLTGDGALGYAAGELATVVEHGLPVTIVVLNNRSFGWIRWYQRITFGRGWEEDDFSDVAFADVARGFGLHGERVTSRPARAGAAGRPEREASPPGRGDRGLADADQGAPPGGAAGREQGTQPACRWIWRPTDAPSPRAPPRAPRPAGRGAAAGRERRRRGRHRQSPAARGHPPLGTDAFAALSIAERVAHRLDTAVVQLGPVGVAHYHLPWPGTLSLSPSTLVGGPGRHLRRAGQRGRTPGSWW